MNERATLAVLATTCLACLAAGCAAQYRPLERGDWVKTHTAYERNDALGRVYSPAPGAGVIIVTRAEYERQVEEGRLPKVSGILGLRVAYLGEMKLIKLKVGEIKTLSVKEARVAGIALRGDAARAFWTRPFLVHSSTGPPQKESSIHLQGLARGEARLRLVQVDDAVTEVPIVVE
jgi:hypothetical protein